MNHPSKSSNFHPEWRRFAEIDSTNEEGKRLALQEYPNPVILSAQMQTNGRGRMGRNFYSPAETGIYFSFYCPVSSCENLVTVTSFSAVSVRRAILSLAGIGTDIKWVNDLYYQGKKVCGILAEHVVINQFHAMIVGIGINLQTEFDASLNSVAGSLNTDIDKDKLIELVSRDLYSFLLHPTLDFIPEYREHCFVLGKKVSLIENGNCRDAIAVGIGDRGELIVRNEKGETEQIFTGEISLRILPD